MATATATEPTVSSRSTLKTNPLNRHATKRLRNQSFGSSQPPTKHTPATNPTIRAHSPQEPKPSHRVIEAVRAEGATKAELISKNHTAPTALTGTRNAKSDQTTLESKTPPTTTTIRTAAAIFTDSLLFHLTNLCHIEERQRANPKQPLSQSHQRSLSRAFRFANTWYSAVCMPHYSGGLTVEPHPSLPLNDDDAYRWLLALARRIYVICDRHMMAAHFVLLNDPEATCTLTDFAFESLRDRVSSLPDFFTIAHHHPPIRKKPTPTTPQPPKSDATAAPTPLSAPTALLALSLPPGNAGSQPSSSSSNNPEHALRPSKTQQRAEVGGAAPVRATSYDQGRPMP